MSNVPPLTTTVLPLASTLALGASNVLANGSTVVVNGGTFDIAGNSDTVAGVQLASGSITGSGGTLTSTSAHDLRSGTVSAVLGGAVGATKTTAGTVTLSGANSYSGVTTVNAGTLAFNSIANVGAGPSALGTPTRANSTIALAGGVTLQYTGTGHASDRVIGLGDGGGIVDASGSGTLTLSGGITGADRNLALTGTGAGVESGVIATGTGTLTKNGTGTWTLAGAGANTFTGTTRQRRHAGAEQDGGRERHRRRAGRRRQRGRGRCRRGPAACGQPDSGRRCGDCPSSGRLDPNGFAETLGTLTLNSGTGSGANVTTGAGTLNLGGNVTLAVNGTGAVGAVISGNLALGGATRTFTVADGTAASDLTVSALMSGGANLGITKAGVGTLTLSGANTYTGVTTVNAGTLAFNSIANVGAGASALGTPTLANSTIALAGGATLQYTGTGHASDRVIGLGDGGGIVDASGSGTLTLSGGITGANRNLARTGTGAGVESGVIATGTGTLTKNGTGTWTLSGAGANTFTGTTTVNAGMLELNKTAGVNAIGGALVVGDNAGGADADVVRLLAANQIPAACGDGPSSGRLDLNGFAEAIGTLTLNSGTGSGANVTTGAGTLNLGGNVTLAVNGTGAVGAAISGNLALGVRRGPSRSPTARRPATSRSRR